MAKSKGGKRPKKVKKAGPNPKKKVQKRAQKKQRATYG